MCLIQYITTGTATFHIERLEIAQRSFKVTTVKTLDQTPNRHSRTVAEKSAMKTAVAKCRANQKTRSVLAPHTPLLAPPERGLRSLFQPRVPAVHRFAEIFWKPVK